MKLSFSFQTTIRFFILLFLLISSCIAVFASFYLIEEAKTTLAEDSAKNKRAAIIEIESSKILVGQLKPKLSQMGDEDVSSQSHLVWRVRKIGENEKSKARISFIISNLGLSKEYTMQALTLNNSFTLGFSPYASDVQDWIEQSTGKGFETFLHLPMQQSDYPVNDPGALALLTHLSVADNLSRLNYLMHRSDKIIGFYADEAEVVSNEKATFIPILETLGKFQLIYLNANSSNSDWLEKTSKSIGVELQTTDMILDNDLSPEELDVKLQELLKIADANGKAVAILRAYPYIMEHIDSWINKVDLQKYSIVPLSNQFLWGDERQQPKPNQEEGKESPVNNDSNLTLPVREAIDEVKRVEEEAAASYLQKKSSEKDKGKSHGEKESHGEEKPKEEKSHD